MLVVASIFKKEDDRLTSTPSTNSSTQSSMSDNVTMIPSNTYQGGDLAKLVSGYWYSPETRSYNHTKQHPGEDVEFTEKNPYLKWMDNTLAINI